VDVEADPEQDERPERDRQQGGEDLPPRAQALEVMVYPSDRDADAEVQEQQNATAEEHVDFSFQASRAETLDD